MGHERRYHGIYRSVCDGVGGARIRALRADVVARRLECGTDPIRAAPSRSLGRCSLNAARQPYGCPYQHQQDRYAVGRAAASAHILLFLARTAPFVAGYRSAHRAGRLQEHAEALPDGGDFCILCALMRRWHTLLVQEWRQAGISYLRYANICAQVRAARVPFAVPVGPRTRLSVPFLASDEWLRLPSRLLAEISKDEVWRRLAGCAEESEGPGKIFSPRCVSHEGD